MNIEIIEGWKAAFCAIAGPVGGLMLLLLRRWLPCTAICALIQSCYNLLPIMPLDGGRALLNVLPIMFGAQLGEKLFHVVEIVTIISIFTIALYLCIYHRVPTASTVAILGLMIFAIFRKYPCKVTKQIVQ